MTALRDPVTGATVTATGSLTWDLDGVEPDADVKAIADALYHWLDDQGRGEDGYAPRDVPMVAHASDSYATDHALLTSAISFCLAYDRDDIAESDAHLLRLAALAHELSEDNKAQIAERFPDRANFLDRAWQVLADQEAQLEEALQSDDSLSAFAGARPDADDSRLAVLWYAHVVASSRLYNRMWDDPDAPGDEWRRMASLKAQDDFRQHPLKDAGQIALVHGGATKIKGYVFESARLPEVRGASSLFDRINILDVPALWGRPPRRSDYRDREAYERALARYNAVRERYPALSAPECILYASGGNVLALAPRRLAAQLANAIELIYTAETLTGNSVAVADTFDLLELQYGRRPGDYWLEQFRSHAHDAACQPLLESYYQGTEDAHFVARKGFGELATLLASQANRRRAGRGDEGPDRQRRAIPHYELLPQAIKCHSCDTRPALIAIDQAEVAPNQSPKAFCEPCARKRVTGQVAKRDYERASRWFTRQFDWYPRGVSSWESFFEKFLTHHPNLSDEYFAKLHAKGEDPGGVQAAQDIQEIGAASSPDGYVGYIYADGNDVGALVARIRTPAAYRQFGQRLYLASQAAVFTAFGQHLAAHWQVKSPSADRTGRDRIWVHPFEIITIGGDDLIVIVPGHRTLQIAAAIARELEKRLVGLRPGGKSEPQERYAPRADRLQPTTPEDLWTDERWPAITLSAGVAIARDHTPVPYVSELAEQLQKSAKKARKTGIHAEYPGGTIDFTALKTTGMVSLPWTDYRKRAFDIEETRRLTARPYTWAELRGLLKTAGELKAVRFPRSQLYRLQEDLELSRAAATINYLYFLSHLGREPGQRILEAFHDAWHQNKDVPPWRGFRDDKKKGPTKYETIWRDLVEIYDFVPEPDKGL